MQISNHVCVALKVHIAIQERIATQRQTRATTIKNVIPKTDRPNLLQLEPNTAARVAPKCAGTENTAIWTVVVAFPDPLANTQMARRRPPSCANAHTPEVGFQPYARPINGVITLQVNVKINPIVSILKLPQTIPALARAEML